MALAALFGALALFWISTRQFPTLWRLLIWLAGAGLLAAAFAQGAPQNEFGLRQALQDAWAHRNNLGEAAIVQAFQRNTVAVAQFVPQLLDFFLIAGALMGALALLAFTRGERLEKALRPTILALIGFIAGSTATLAVVAVGFGGYVKPRSYFGYVGAEDVHDGDTFRIGEVSLRLFGVDAPELDQVCRNLHEAKCGETARAFLLSQLSRGITRCDQEVSGTGRLRDTFGRALVSCELSAPDGSTFNIGEVAIRSGFAVPYEGRNYDYGDAEREARHAGAGIMGGCTLRPDVWRNNAEARASFETGGQPPAGLATGNCTTPATGQ